MITILVIQLGTLVLRKITNNKSGIAVGTQPLSTIMEEKMRNTKFPTAIVTMDGQIKQAEDITISSPEADILGGACLIIIGHAESLACPGGQMLLRKLKKNGQIIFTFVDESHQGLYNHWESIRY